MQSNLVQVVETQDVIISMQSGIINDLFQLLSQYLSAEELDTLSVVDKINRAAEIRAGIE